MIKASIVSIGTEIMRGRIEDSNSTFISRWLNKLGIMVKWRLNVSDSIKDIVEALNVVKESDIIIMTGGLGPTDDDCTREGLSKFLNKDFVFNDNVWKNIVCMFEKRKIKIPDSNKKQAFIVPGGEFIKNKIGTAPGIFYKENNKVYILLPGPPVENQLMINNYLFDKFKNNGLIEGEIIAKILRAYNVGESELADSLSAIKTSCDIGYYFSQEGWIELHISKYSMNNDDKILNEVNNIYKNIIDILGKNNYFYTEDKDISLLLLNLLKKKKLTISFGESITGGNISGEFIKNAGASEVLLGGIIAYSNEAKIKLLNVDEKIINEYGAVSEQCAGEMVNGLKSRFGSDISVSITGIAGPTGGNENKPVGLVYFGFIIKDHLFIKKEIFFGNRSRILKKCISYVLIEVYKYLFFEKS